MAGIDRIFVLQCLFSSAKLERFPSST